MKQNRKARWSRQIAGYAATNEYLEFVEEAGLSQIIDPTHIYDASLTLEITGTIS